MKIDPSEARKIVSRYREQRGTLIEVLQEIQAAYGYVHREVVDLIAEDLGYSSAHIFGVLTFYEQFRLVPRGEHILRICQGTACHVMGGRQIFDYLSQSLGIGDGETTRDKRFTLERVACVGACGMAPVMVMDEATHGDLDIQKARDIVSRELSSPQSGREEKTKNE